MTPRSTVRLQLNPGYTLDQAAAQLPYYAGLGVSHLYLSPISCARTDSMHGYDVTNHRSVDPQIGGEAALERLVRTAHRHRMGLIVDIVPNHMAAHPENLWWYSVLQQGRSSPFAQWFDIQWERPGLQGRLLLPVLGRPYGLALEQGDIRLLHTGNAYALDVHGLRLPLADGSLSDADKHEDVATVLARYDPASRAGRAALHGMLQRQHYRLAWWQCAADQINWRRFFEISELVGVCVERDEVFDAVHELPLRLFELGWIDGLRIDHVDGLAYPLDYCERLYQALLERMPLRPEGRHEDRPWLIVEKILAHGEYLDRRWQVDGTTGYDFMEAVSAVMHDPAGEERLDLYWNSIVHDARPVDDWRREARALMITRHFAAERDALLDLFVALAQGRLATSDASRHSLGRALDCLLIEFSVYRSYETLSQHSADDRRYLEQARDRAHGRLVSERDLAAARVLDCIVDVLKGRGKSVDLTQGRTAEARPGQAGLQKEALRRFQQLTPPLAAKALEDTVFYRYGRLLSRNEVGSDPGLFSMPVEGFHRWNHRRAESEPRAMNATATHDHKRGEDTRARLAVISEMPHAWQELSTRCLQAMGQQITIDCGVPAAHCYMLLQTIVAAWPPELRSDDEAGMAAFIERLQLWQLKALREAKQRTSWFYPDESYEQEQAGRVEFLLCDPDSASCRALTVFVDHIAPAAALNSLAAVVMRCTLPGVPDLYQGTDLWDFSLVDPDNRRPVDLERRVVMLNALNQGKTSLPGLLSSWPSGAIKQAVLARCLHLRAQQPELFLRGTYHPLSVEGPLAKHVMAFYRCHEDREMVVVVSRLACRAVQRTGRALALPLIPPDLWQDTRIMLPAALCHDSLDDVLSGARHSVTGRRIQVGAVLARLPVAVLSAV